MRWWKLNIFSRLKHLEDVQSMHNGRLFDLDQLLKIKDTGTPHSYRTVPIRQVLGKVLEHMGYEVKIDVDPYDPKCYKVELVKKE